MRSSSVSCDSRSNGSAQLKLILSMDASVAARRPLVNTPPGVASIGLALVDDRFGLDLDLVLADQAGNLQQGVDRPDFAEIAAVDAGDGLALRGVLQVDSRAHDVLEPAAERRKARGDLVENKHSLPRWVARADDLARAVRRGGAADQNAVLHAHCAAVAGDRFPGAPRVDAPALGPASDANRLIDLR